MQEEMTCLERFHAALELKPVDRLPVTGITQNGIVELMEACGAAWPEAFWDAEKMARLSWAAYEIGGLESVRIPYEGYFDAEIWGGELDKWKNDNMPVLKKFPVKKPEDVDRLFVPDPERDGRYPAVMKAIEILAEECEREKVPLVLQVPGAFLEAFVSVTGVATGSMWMMREPELFKKVVDVCHESSMEYAKAGIKRGVDTIFYNDTPTCTISPKQCEEFAWPWYEQGVKKIKEQGAYVIQHLCGDSRHILGKQPELGVHAVSIGQETPVADARKIVGDKVALCGNVSPTVTLLKKNPKDVIEEAKQCIEEGIDVLAPGCGFAPRTPLANMKALAEAGKKYGRLGRLARK